MTGPEHYFEAERILAGQTIPADPELGDPERHYPPTLAEIAAAQVHATLALAAATARAGTPGGMPHTDWKAWHEAAGVLTAADGTDGSAS